MDTQANNQVKAGTPLMMGGVDLITWCREQPDTNNEKSNLSMWSQIFLVRDILPRIWSMGDLDVYKHYCEGPGIQYLGFHISRSRKLPVLGIVQDRLGFRAVLRNNFYNWTVSIDSDREIFIVSPEGLFDPDKPAMFFEGFDDHWKVGTSYNQDKRRFSFTCNSDGFDLYTIFWQINLALSQGG